MEILGDSMLRASGENEISGHLKFLQHATRTKEANIVQFH